MVEERIKIGVCVPLYNQVPTAFFIHFVSFFAQTANKYPLEIFQVDATIVDVARNVLVENFLKSDCTHLLFLDSDMVFPPNIVELLLKHDKEVVSGLYFLRKMLLPSFRMLNKEGNYQSSYDFPKNELVKVDATGLGCMLIKRKVLEKVDSENKGKPLFFTKYDKGMRTKVHGEDTAFCELVKKAGFEIYVDTGLILGHYGGIIPDAKFRGYIY
ncbi:MAG: hypothetical protein JW772_02740 [Candidatus Diapherotrites archaeon]|nr:hypothetical protein [Candidatus Diapherotrites archaeon]